MKNIFITIPIMIAVLAGCTKLSLQMRVDPSLETNAKVYEVISQNAWFTDEKLNVSFGEYWVSDANTGWRTTQTSLATETSFTNQLFGMNSSDATNIKSSQTITYKFNIGDNATWESKCVHLADKRVTKNKNVSSLEILSSRYTCHYNLAEHEPWDLSVEQNDLGQIDIRMTNRVKFFRAHSTAGIYLTPDGRPYETIRPPDAGYTWLDDENVVAAISVKEKKPRIWLDKRNPDSMNRALGMASVGLLIYHWKILPELKKHYGL